MSGHVGRSAIGSAWLGGFSWTLGRPAMALLGAFSEIDPRWQAYPELAAQEVPSGGGYITGGLRLLRPEIRTYLAAEIEAWQPLTRYPRGAVVRSEEPNGRVYLASGGVTGPAAYRLNEADTRRGDTVNDGSLTWTDVGSEVTAWTSEAVRWVGTIAARGAAIYDSESEAVACLLDFGRGETSANAEFLVEPDPVLGWFWAVGD